MERAHQDEYGTVAGPVIKQVPNNQTEHDTAHGAAESDQVSVDSHRSLLATALSPSSVDQSNKVEELRRVVSAGQYSVDPVEVSRAVIRSLLAGE